MVENVDSFDNEPLEKLVEDHANLKRELGSNHFLVEALWTEIRRRKSLQVIVPEPLTASASN